MPIALVTGPFIPDLIASFMALSALVLLLMGKFKLNIEFKFLLLFYTYILLLNIFSSYELNSSIFYLRFIFFAIFISQINGENFIVHFTKIFFLLFLFLFFDGIIEFIFNVNIFGYPRYSEERLSSLFRDELVLGKFLSHNFIFILLGLLFFLKNTSLKNKSILIYIFIFIFSFYIFLIGERSAFIFTLLSVFIYLKLIREIKLIKILFPCLIFILFIFLLYFLDKREVFIFSSISRMIDLTITQIFFTYGEFNFNFFSDQHENHYKIAIKMFLDNPIFGHGPKSFRILCSLPPYNIFENGCSTHPHHIYLELMSETGIFGLMFILIFLTYVIIRIFNKNTSKEEKLLLIPILIILWPFVPTMSFFSNWINIIYFIPVGILFNNQVRTKIKEVI